MIQRSSASVAIVLDATAILAVLQDEPGRLRVEEVLAGAFVSSVNWSEVIGKLVDSGLPDDDIANMLKRLPVIVEPFTEADAERAGDLRRRTGRDAGLSLGDRACLALAQRLSATVLTADRAWSRLELGVVVEQIR